MANGVNFILDLIYFSFRNFDSIMHITKSVFVPLFQGNFQVFEFLGEDKHWATNMIIPAILNNIRAIRMSRPHFKKFKLGNKL